MNSHELAKIQLKRFDSAVQVIDEGSHSKVHMRGSTNIDWIFIQNDEAFCTQANRDRWKVIIHDRYF